MGAPYDYVRKRLAVAIRNTRHRYFDGVLCFCDLVRQQQDTETSVIKHTSDSAVLNQLFTTMFCLPNSKNVANGVSSPAQAAATIVNMFFSALPTRG